MGLFDRDKEEVKEVKRDVKKSFTSSRLGRSITTKESAKEEFYFKPHNFNPRDYINKKEDDLFYGLLHNKEEQKGFYLPQSEVTMQLLIGSTGTFKGVLLGNFVLEKIQRKEGVIIIDPKQDDFLPQVCKEELTRQGRPEDLLIASFPENFGYMGINQDDSYTEVANKLIDCFGLEETGNPGVDHYRKLERVMLKKVLKIFFDGALGQIVRKDLNEIADAIVKLAEDLKRKQIFEEESAKNKPNVNLIQRNSKRYFDGDKLDLLNFNEDDIETLKSLAISFDEFVSSGKISNKINLDEALYKNKVIYLKIDMLDIASLKMAKICITDAIQKARKKLPKTKIWIICDEISFYANQTLAGALATTRGFNLNFILALQDIAQMKEENIRNAILSNVNVKIFYKPSDKSTLEYLELLGGKEAVTKFSKKENDITISQETEEVFNSTRVRSLPRAGVAVLVSEFLSTPVVIQTNFVRVEGKFDWSVHNVAKNEKKEDYSNMEVKIQTRKDIEDKLMKFRQKLKGTYSLCDGLDGVLFENEAL